MASTAPCWLKGAGYPAVEGWYATIAAPYLAENPDVAPWIKRYQESNVLRLAVWIASRTVSRLTGLPDAAPRSRTTSIAS